MLCDNFLQACVQSLSVFVENHGVSVSIKFLEAQARVVFSLNFLENMINFLACVPIAYKDSNSWKHSGKSSASGFESPKFKPQWILNIYKIRNDAWFLSLDSDIESKSSNNTYLNIIEIFTPIIKPCFISMSGKPRLWI